MLQHNTDHDAIAAHGGTVCFKAPLPTDMLKRAAGITLLDVLS